MCIPHIGTKRKPLTKVGSPNILVHVEAVYNDSQVVLDFLCRHVLGSILDVHARADAFATYNGMIRGYTENLVIRCTLVIKCIISAATIYRHMRLTSGLYGMYTIF